MTSYVKTELTGGVGRITLARAQKRNALTRDFVLEIADAVRQLQTDPSLRILCLQAEGSVFCAGMDLGEMQERATSPNGREAWAKDSEVFQQLLASLVALPVPTLAVLQGPVLAGGVGLVLACDLVLSNDNAFWMLPEPQRGIVAAIVTPLLVHRIGAGRAGQLLLSGEKQTAERAKAYGLVYDVVVSDQLDQRTDSLLESILTGAPAALAMTKQHLIACSSPDLLTQLETSIQFSAQARETADAREGLAAFLEKRKPYWQNSELAPSKTDSSPK